MKYTLGIIAAVVVIGAGIYLLSQGPGAAPAQTGAQNAIQAGAQPSQPASGATEKLPALTLKDYSGKDVSLASFSGKPLIVNSWASWCPFCRQELPDFVSLQKEFPGITIVAVDRQEPLQTAKTYTDQEGVTDKLVFLLDPSDSFYQAIGGFSMPETIFVDASGAVVFHKRGPLSLDEMRQEVAELKFAQ